MPYKTGNWGEQAKARSQRRKEYFRVKARQRYAIKTAEILSKCQTRRDLLPEITKAQNQARHAIKISNGQLCEMCHNALATQRHHPDYMKPLDVKFLCSSCHRIITAKDAE
jgi:hypothetical protein